MPTVEFLPNHGKVNVGNYANLLRVIWKNKIPISGFKVNIKEGGDGLNRPGVWERFLLGKNAGTARIPLFTEVQHGQVVIQSQRDKA